MMLRRTGAVVQTLLILAEPGNCPHMYLQAAESLHMKGGQRISASPLKHHKASQDLVVLTEGVAIKGNDLNGVATGLGNLLSELLDGNGAVLDELLQSQGLTRGVHYDVQTVLRDADGRTVRSESGGTLRPDVILHLDQNRDVIIDSKVSLSAFMDYVNASDEQERSLALAAHLVSLNSHVKELSAKDYSSYVKPPKICMNYVIMFVPNTGALWTALNAQPDLWRQAMEKNVFIADEQTLYAALRIIDMTWTQIKQVESYQKVFALADEMMDRVGQFMKKYRDIGDALSKAQKLYDEGEKKLEPSGQSILQTCAKLQRLGASQSAKNPLPQLSDAALSEDKLTADGSIEE